MRIELRDGKVVENRMSDVLSFGFDKGQLSVRLKDGKVFRYALLDVAKFSIE
jgi:coenzyme F420-reducing hydrogenase beta subunit